MAEGPNTLWEGNAHKIIKAKQQIRNVHKNCLSQLVVTASESECAGWYGGYE